MDVLVQAVMPLKWLRHSDLKKAAWPRTQVTQRAPRDRDRRDDTLREQEARGHTGMTLCEMEKRSSGWSRADTEETGEV